MQKINTEEVFWERVDIKGADDCWEWKAKRYPYGYGAFKYKGKQCGAHRYAYAFANGVPEESLGVVRHTCDNPPCCNPNHSFRGTQADNIRDMKRKGRWRVASNVKLTADQVRSIRNSVASGKTYKRVADDFGVCMSTVAHIIEGRSWCWLSIVG